MRAVACALVALLFGRASCPAPIASPTGKDRGPIDEVLDDWHRAAAESDLESYFARARRD